MADMSRKRSPPARDLSGNELVEFIRQTCKEQAAQAKMITDAFLPKPKMREYAKWFRDDRLWRDVATVCGPEVLARLTSELKSSLGGSTDPRTVFLTGLSFLKTSNAVWDTIIGATTGLVHARFLEIRQFEDEANAQISPLPSNTPILMRGSSTIDALDMFYGQSLYRGGRSFVSMSPVLQRAVKFALYHGHIQDCNRIVMFMDASRVRKLEPGFAQYSIASEALQLMPYQEAVLRSFRFKFAPEMQVHFDGRWPPGASDALLAIWPVVKLDSQALGEVARIGVPVVSLDDI